VASSEIDYIQLSVPAELKRQLALQAAEERSTIRAVILRALVKAGYEIPAEEIRDKRRV
jgi:hypothetical protein